MRLRAVVGAIFGAALMLVGTTSPPAASAAPPKYFVGLQGWTTPPAHVFSRLNRAGVNTWRTNLQWSSVERRRGRYNWRRYDRLFAESARRRVRIFPVLVGSPPWVTRNPHYPPMTSATRSAFYRFVRVAVARYGPNGRFWRWRGIPKEVRPRYWQIWNEPNLPNWWNRRVDPPDYGRFLKYSSMSAKGADSEALIVAAGMPQTHRTYPIDDFLREMFRVPGVAEATDAVAVQPYAADYRGVLGLVATTYRQTRASLGKSKPIFVTEFGWGTGGSHPSFTTSYSGQASRLGSTLERLIAYRPNYRLRGVFWFSLRDRDSASSWHHFTGLFDRFWDRKPAWNRLAELAGGRP